MIIGLIILLFTFNALSNEVPYYGNGEFDANNPPIEFLVRQHLNIENGTPQEFVENIFSNAQISTGIGTDKMTYNLTYPQQQDFIKKYLIEAAIGSSWGPRTNFQKQVKQLAESTYAPDLDYKFYDRVQDLTEQGVKGTAFYHKLLEEGHSNAEIKSMLHKKIANATAYSQDGKYDERDKLLDFALRKNLTDDKFITAQFESMLMHQGVIHGISGEPAKGRDQYSEIFKKLAKKYDPAGSSQYGDNLLCSTLAWASYSIRDPDSDDFGGIGYNNQIVTEEQKAENVNRNFKSLSKIIGVLSDFEKDTTNGGKKCFTGMSAADYLAQFSNHQLFNIDDPNFQKWIDKLLKIEKEGDCNKDKLNGVLPEDLCQKDVLLGEAAEYLKEIKRVGSDVQHIYTHQINNCLIVMFSKLSSASSKMLSDDDFSMEIKYLEPKGAVTQLDKVDKIRNFKKFQMEMKKRRDFALKNLAK
jgi:hypothetical protein